MNLTIQKFSSPNKARKLLLTAIMLIMPLLIIATAWFVFDFRGMKTTKAAAGINSQINYQAKIASSAGTALATGSYNFSFNIYDAASAGSSVWEESWTSTTTPGQVSVTSGTMSVALGTSTSLSAVDFNSDSLWLEVQFDADSNGSFEETFTPRKKLTAAPYAFNADTVDGISAATTATASSLLALDATSGMTLNAVTTTDTVYIGGLLSVAGNATISGSATTTGNQYVATNLQVGGVAHFDAEVASVASSGFTINWNNGNKQKVTITGTDLAATFTAPAGPANLILKVVQGDGDDTITWPASVKWPAGTAPTLSTAGSAIDIISCYYDGTNYYCQGALTFS